MSGSLIYMQVSSLADVAFFTVHILRQNLQQFSNDSVLIDKVLSSQMQVFLMRCSVSGSRVLKTKLLLQATSEGTGQRHPLLKATSQFNAQKSNSMVNQNVCLLCRYVVSNCLVSRLNLFLVSGNYMLLGIKFWIDSVITPLSLELGQMRGIELLPTIQNYIIICYLKR